MDRQLTDALTRMTSAIESTSTQVTNLTTSVNQISAESQQNRADLDRLIAEMHHLRGNPVPVNVAVAAPLPAPAPAHAPVPVQPLLFNKEPPKLPMLTKGKDHHNIVSRVSASIKLWHGEAHHLMTNKDESFTVQGGVEIFMLDDDPNLHRFEQNESTFNLLLTACDGRARSAISLNIKRVQANMRDLAVGLHDPLDGAYDPRQSAALESSCFLAWQAITEHNPDLAIKYFDALQNHRCASLIQLSAHLDRMTNHYDTYAGCVEQFALQAQQSQLSAILIDSLPDKVRTDVRNTLRPTPAHLRNWDDTIAIAHSVLAEIQSEARRKVRDAPPKARAPGGAQ